MQNDPARIWNSVEIYKYMMNASIRWAVDKLLLPPLLLLETFTVSVKYIEQGWTDSKAEETFSWKSYCPLCQWVTGVQVLFAPESIYLRFLNL